VNGCPQMFISFEIMRDEREEGRLLSVFWMSPMSRFDCCFLSLWGTDGAVLLEGSISR